MSTQPPDPSLDEEPPAEAPHEITPEPRRPDAPRRRAVVRLLLWLGFLLAAGGALTGGLSGYGHRMEWWDFRVGFTLLRWAVIAGLAGLGIASVGFLSAALLRRWGLMAGALPAMALGLAVVAVPLFYVQNAATVPPIHDITTDTANPPEFVALRETREAAPNGAEYAGEAVAEQQRQAYPGVRPLIVDAAPERAFEAALAVAEAAGWNIAASDFAAGRIEATATTFWYGFKDDVVIRVSPAEQSAGTRIDVRSVSRVGQSDLGANAARVRTFLDDLWVRLEGRT